MVRLYAASGVEAYDAPVRGLPLLLILFLPELAFLILGISLLFTPHRMLGFAVLAVLAVTAVILTGVVIYVRRFADRN